MHLCYKNKFLILSKMLITNRTTTRQEKNLHSTVNKVPAGTARPLSNELPFIEIVQYVSAAV
jgi:hypothetical protein